MSTSKKQIITGLIERARKFRVHPSDDGDEETAITVGYRHLVIQFKRLAGSILPEAPAARLDAIDIEVNDIYSALDAKAELDALLPDIESALERLDERHGAIYRLPPGDLRKEIELQRSLMIAVATGGPRIQTVNNEYQTRRAKIRAGLAEREIEEPNPYDDLWAWYSKWSGGDLPTYQSRRQFISELYTPALNQIRSEETGQRGVREDAPTGWVKVDRGIHEARQRLSTAVTEEQFQAVGLICREVLISLGQTVFDPQNHPTHDGVAASQTDAKRMLDAYIAKALAGGANEVSRRHAKAALDLANQLQHDRTASFRDATLCEEATTSVVNLIAIIARRRNP